MATTSEAKQTFKSKNFKQVLSYYYTLIKKAMLEPVDGLSSQSPFNPESWTVAVHSSSGGDSAYDIVTYVTYENSGHSYGFSILKAFNTTSSNILEALRTLFINYDDPETMWQEEFNFNLLNAYASASKSLQWYNQDTEEFEMMPEYWFTRGCWYEMLPMCTKGDYLKAWYPNVLSAVEAIKKCRRYYEKEFKYYVYDSTGSDDYYGGSYYASSGRRYTTSGYYTSRRASFSEYGNTMGYIRAFWDFYLKTLQNEVDKLLEPIWKIGRETNLKEQTAKTAKLTYVTQLASDIDVNYATEKTIISTAKTLSSMCGKYTAKSAGLKLTK